MNEEYFIERIFRGVDVVGGVDSSRISTSCKECCYLKTAEGDELEVYFYLVEKTSEQHGTFRVAGSTTLNNDFMGYLNPKLGIGKLILLKQ